jgi:hypothetical protein
MIPSYHLTFFQPIYFIKQAHNSRVLQAIMIIKLHSQPGWLKRIIGILMGGEFSCGIGIHLSTST